MSSCHFVMEFKKLGVLEWKGTWEQPPTWSETMGMSVLLPKATLATTYGLSYEKIMHSEYCLKKLKRGNFVSCILGSACSTDLRDSIPRNVGPFIKQGFAWWAINAPPTGPTVFWSSVKKLSVFQRTWMNWMGIPNTDPEDGSNIFTMEKME